MVYVYFNDNAVSQSGASIAALGATNVYACCTHGVLSGPAIERINKLLEAEPEFIEALYGDTCFRYDHPEIYSETCKKVFEDYLLNSIPVRNLDMMIGGNLD